MSENEFNNIKKRFGILEQKLISVGRNEHDFEKFRDACEKNFEIGSKSERRYFGNLIYQICMKFETDYPEKLKMFKFAGELGNLNSVMSLIDIFIDDNDFASAIFWYDKCKNTDYLDETYFNVSKCLQKLSDFAQENMELRLENTKLQGQLEQEKFKNWYRNPKK